MATQQSVQEMHDRNQEELKTSKALFLEVTKDMTTREYRILTAVALHMDAITTVMLSFIK
jgi:hypothetical protein